MDANMVKFVGLSSARVWLILLLNVLVLPLRVWGGGIDSLKNYLLQADKSNFKNQDFFITF